jgi:hypothetical protein
MLSAREKNVRILLLSGHGKSHCGFLWLKDESSEYDDIKPDRFVKLFSPVAAGTAGGTIECVVLNACETEDIGKKLRKAGVPYVVCWRSKVDDTTATNFAVDFFKSLNQSDVTKKMDYKLAFQQAVVRMKEHVGGSRGQTHAFNQAVKRRSDVHRSVLMKTSSLCSFLLCATASSAASALHTFCGAANAAYLIFKQKLLLRFLPNVDESRGQNCPRALIDPIFPIFGPIEKHLSEGAMDYVCFLSQGHQDEDDDEFPDTGYIRMV